jgi:hypothetical protein
MGWILTKSMKARLMREPLPVPLTERLPHIRIPIGEPQPTGNWNQNPTMSGIFDTGSGLTIGRLPYWRSVADRYPELIHEFGEMSEDSNEQIRVGGIEQDGQGATCTHFISIKTPFIENGKAVKINIALTEELSCNLIFGLPLIVKAKMTAYLWEKYVTSQVFGASFPLDYHPPFHRDTVVMQVDSPIALKAMVENQE